VGVLEMTFFMGLIFERISEEVGLKLRGESDEIITHEDMENRKSSFKKQSVQTYITVFEGIGNYYDEEGFNGWIKNDETWRGFGDAATIAGLPLVACTLYKKAVELEPGRCSNHVCLAKSLFKLNKVEAAVAVMREALKIGEGSNMENMIASLVYLWSNPDEHTLFEEEMAAPLDVILEDYVVEGSVAVWRDDDSTPYSGSQNLLGDAANKAADAELSSPVEKSGTLTTLARKRSILVNSSIRGSNAGDTAAEASSVRRKSSLMQKFDLKWRESLLKNLY